MAFGGVVLQSAVIDLHLPLLGDLHLVSSVLFDVGVYLVVVGLVLDLLRALGSHIDRDIQRAMREARGGGRMTINLTLVLVAAALLGCGVYLVLERSLSRVLIGIVMIGNGVSLCFMVAGGPAGRAPIVSKGGDTSGLRTRSPRRWCSPPSSSPSRPTAFVLAMAYRSWQLNGHDDVQDDVEDDDHPQARPARRDVRGLLRHDVRLPRRRLQRGPRAGPGRRPAGRRRRGDDSRQ